MSLLGERTSSTEEHSARFLWLLLVVNVAILATALVMAAACCRRPGAGYLSTGPYTYLPGLTRFAFTGGHPRPWA